MNNWFQWKCLNDKLIDELPNKITTKIEVRSQTILGSNNNIYLHKMNVNH